MSPTVPDQADVDALRGLLDLMDGFRDNDQRARFLLSSNWLRDRGASTQGSPTGTQSRDGYDSPNET